MGKSMDSLLSRPWATEEEAKGHQPEKRHTLRVIRDPEGKVHGYSWDNNEDWLLGRFVMSLGWTALPVTKPAPVTVVEKIVENPETARLLKEQQEENERLKAQIEAGSKKKERSKKKETPAESAIEVPPPEGTTETVTETVPAPVS